MIKIIIFVTIFTFSILFANGVKIIGEGCNIRDIAVPFSKSKVIGKAYPGNTFKIANAHCDYVKVKIEEGSDHSGKIGWIWTGLIADTNPTIGDKLIFKGGSLRSEPFKTDDNRIARVKAGIKVVVISKKISRYKIKNDKIVGWVPSQYIKFN
jgi:hypothetical protein